MMNIFFSKDCAINEKMSKNLAEQEIPQMTTQYGAYALHAEQSTINGRTRINAPTSLGNDTHMYVATFARAHTHTKTNM